MIFLSNRKLKLIIITLLLLIFCFFLGMFRPKAQVLPIQADYGVTYGNNAQLINSPNSNTTWNWGYNFNNTSGRVDALEIYFHSNGEDITSFNQYLTFMVGGYNQTFPVTNNEMTPFSVGGAILKVKGATYMCSVDSNNSNTSYNNNSFNTWSATINCDTSSGVNIGKSSNFASLWIQINSINGYSQFYTYISKDMYASDTKLFTNNNAVNDIKTNTQNINDSINNSDIDNNGATSSANTWNSKNATNGTITNLLTLPITLLQAIVSGLQTSCSSFSLGSLFGTNITLPCINVGNLIGSGLWTTIDILFSGFMILAIAKKLIKIFNDFTNLKSNQMDELYGGGNK